MRSSAGVSTDREDPHWRHGNGFMHTERTSSVVDSGNIEPNVPWRRNMTDPVMRRPPVVAHHARTTRS